MKLLKLALCFLFVLALTFSLNRSALCAWQDVTTDSAEQDSAVQDQEMPPEEAEAEMPVPTEHHKVLADDVGDWDIEMKMYMGPGEPAVIAGTETNTMCGGFWKTSELNYEYGGEQVTGHGTFGYDVESEKYVGTWIDSMSQHMSKMEGTYDEATRTMTMHSEMHGPMGDMMQIRMVSVQQDENNRTFTMEEFTGADEEGNDQYQTFLEMTCVKRN